MVCAMETVRDERQEKGDEVQRAGGVGMILVAPVLVDMAFLFAVPTSLLGEAETEELNQYLHSERYLIFEQVEELIFVILRLF